MTLFSDFTSTQFALLMGIFLLGGMVKGALGFGLPLATMAVLPLVVPVELALAINAVMLPFTNVTQFVQARRMRETLIRFRYLIGGVVLGVPLGAGFVTAVDEDVLMVGLGLFVILFSTITAFKPRVMVPAAGGRAVGAGVGVIAGIVGALTAANGPIFVMYLVGLRVDRGLFLSALGLFFVVSGILITSSFWFVGMMDIQRLLLAVLCAPAAVAGMQLGGAVARRVSAERFQLLVLGVLCVLGVNLVLQGVRGL